ncbi:hypothetical protein ABFX02_10G113000 [Erythranthe guttata]
MGCDKKIVMIGMLVAAATLLSGCAADTRTVGDSLGWTIPPAGDIAYRTWAAKEDFELGDSIIFRWSGTHNVVQVTKEGYENCNATSNLSLSPVQTTSPFTFILNSTTPHYFICTVENHCRLGQKVTIQIRQFPSAAPSSLIKSGGIVSALLLVVASLFM